ncbi:Tryptophan--tRNA ligase [uncultured archaeon]|nr:Tryptophan--tRNA ligase [uncultured archaeon]
MRGEKTLSVAGKYVNKNDEWIGIPAFDDRKNPDGLSDTKAVVTEGGNMISFHGLKGSIRAGPVGTEAVLYDNVADKVPAQVYDALRNYSSDKPLIVQNEQFDSCRNPSELVRNLSHPESFGIVSGRKPSGPCHFGHKLVIDTLGFFQKNGAQIFMPIADTEASLDSKMKDNSQYMYLAADNLLDWGASGLNLNAAHVYLQSEEMRVMNLGYAAARQLDLALTVDVYGRDMLADEMNFLFASITQVGDILLPQHRDFGKSHSIMLSGADQDGNMKMTMSLASRMLSSKFAGHVRSAPSSLYVRSISNMEGKKESASEPETTIYLGPSRNVYAKTSTGRVLEKVKALSLDERIDDVCGKIDRFKESDAANVLATIQRRSKVLKDFEGLARHAGSDDALIEGFKEEVVNSITAHQANRRVVYEYALSRALQDYLNASGQGAASPQIERIYAGARANEVSVNSTSLAEPVFWAVPEGARVAECNKRFSTKWYHIVAVAADKLKV